LDTGTVGEINAERRYCDSRLTRDRAPATKKNKLKPWQVKSWCIPEVTPEFIKRMEHILELYQKPYDSKRPMVCFDKKSFRLLAQIIDRLALKPGHAS